MSAPPKRDWQKTRLHAGCGFFLGAAPTLFNGGGWVAVLVWGLILGLLAGIFLDSFWADLRSWWS